jgi:adenosylcobinamide kinase/adenosylcobinamide-phosphate guanylyltransferase
VTVDDRFRLREGAVAGVLPAGYEVTLTADGLLVVGPDGARLLYARSGPGPQPSPPLVEAGPGGGSAYSSAPPDQQVDMVIVDAAQRPEVIGELRRSGVVGVTTAVVAVGGDHRVRSPQEFARRARLWGALAPSDGAEMSCPPAVWPESRPRGPHRTLVTGGARSGKSTEAELRLLAEPDVLYVATGPVPDPGLDPEWALRVERHRSRRPSWWRTEQTTELAEVLGRAEGAVLVDCLGTWLAAVMDEYGMWDDSPSAEAEELVGARVRGLLDAWRTTRAYVVAVTNEVGSGVVPATRSGRVFRDHLGQLNQWVGAESEEVVLAAAGRVVELP